MKETFDGKEIKEELVFAGFNPEKFVENVLNQTRKKFAKGMSDSELKAFDFGVSTVLSILNNLIQNDDADFIVITDDEIITEHSLEELEEISRKDSNHE